MFCLLFTWELYRQRIAEVELRLAKRILVVDDEASIVELLKFNLQREGYEALDASDGETAIRLVRSDRPDLVILDIMLPGIDGIEACQAIRRESNVPIIMLTAKSEEFDTVLGLSVGADDYMAKPFSTRELMARVKAVLRRQATDAAAHDDRGDELLRIGDVEIDGVSFQVRAEGKHVEVTPKEFELLRLLMANAGRVLTREVILERVWGYDFPGNTRTVDVHIRKLRQKIERDDSQPDYIQTVHGIGYRFRPAD